MLRGKQSRVTVMATVSLLVTVLVATVYAYGRWENRRAYADFVAACEVVQNQVEHRDIMVFAILSEESCEMQQDGYRIRVVYIPEIVKGFSRTRGSYPEHHNSLVMRYTGWEYCHGNKGLALSLLGCLVKADPDMILPTGHGKGVSVEQAYRSLKNGEKQFVDDLSWEASQWQAMLKYRVE